MRKMMTVCLAMSLYTGFALADKPEHAGKGKKEQYKKHSKKHYNKKQFSSSDYQCVGNYYGNLPKGLQKKLKREGKLPPGWQQKVEIGKPFPQEYLQYAQPVPAELSTQISAGPLGSKLLQLSDRVIRIEAGTNMVLDAIRF